jgi:hypothetical protein
MGDSEPGIHQTQSPWRQVVQANRALVPLIECCAGMGSGLLVCDDGLIVTNRHVIDGATLVMVSFYDGTKAKGLVVHKHEYRDLALIRAAVKQGRCFDIACAISAAQAGDEVLAIGHPRGLAFTATRGIVSEPARQLPNGLFVQHDVAINPGNSGGPLLDAGGALVGLNTQFQLGAQGLGFAIPGDEVRTYVHEMLGLVRAGRLPYPTDDEISHTPRQMSAADVLHAAVAASGLQIVKRENRADGAMSCTLATARQATFVACDARQWFDVRWSTAEKLPQAQLRSAAFLHQLLLWQGSMFGPRFILKDGRLQLAAGRSVEGLDVAEAREMILSVADAIDKVAPLLPRG